MSKLTIGALLIAVSIQAQTSSPAQSSSAAPIAPRVVRREQPDNEEARKKLQELGYVFSVPPNLAPARTTPPCAIPLRRIPAPDKGQTPARIIPANPSIDPKMVKAPPLPACPSDVTIAPAREQPDGK